MQRPWGRNELGGLEASSHCSQLNWWGKQGCTHRASVWRAGVSECEGLRQSPRLGVPPGVFAGSNMTACPGLSASLVISTPQEPCSERPRVEETAQDWRRGGCGICKQSLLGYHVFSAWASSHRSQATPGSRPGCGPHECLCVHLSPGRSRHLESAPISFFTTQASSRFQLALK